MPPKFKLLHQPVFEQELQKTRADLAATVPDGEIGARHGNTPFSCCLIERVRQSIFESERTDFRRVQDGCAQAWGLAVTKSKEENPAR